MNGWMNRWKLVATRREGHELLYCDELLVQRTMTFGKETLGIGGRGTGKQKYLLPFGWNAFLHVALPTLSCERREGDIWNFQWYSLRSVLMKKVDGY